MAAPATHIVLAEKLHSRYFPNKDKAPYIVGTSFPDVRYLGVIDREKTHYHGLSIKEIQSENPFNAGLKLHSLVDEIREDFVKHRKLYDLFPESQLCIQAVKFFEDRVLYHKIPDWNKNLSYFENVFPEELEYGISDKDINKWHRLITEILSHEPDDNDIVTFTSEIGKPPQMADEILRVINGIHDKEKAEGIINEFYDTFELLV